MSKQTVIVVELQRSAAYLAVVEDILRNTHEIPEEALGMFNKVDKYDWEALFIRSVGYNRITHTNELSFCKPEPGEEYVFTPVKDLESALKKLFET